MSWFAAKSLCHTMLSILSYIIECCMFVRLIKSVQISPLYIYIHNRLQNPKYVKNGTLSRVTEVGNFFVLCHLAIGLDAIQVLYLPHAEALTRKTQASSIVNHHFFLVGRA